MKEPVGEKIQVQPSNIAADDAQQRDVSALNNSVTSTNGFAIHSTIYNQDLSPTPATYMPTPATIALHLKDKATKPTTKALLKSVLSKRPEAESKTIQAPKGKVLRGPASKPQQPKTRLPPASKNLSDIIELQQYDRMNGTATPVSYDSAREDSQMNERYAGSRNETIQLQGGSAMTNLEVRGSQHAPQRTTSTVRSPPEMATSSV